MSSRAVVVEPISITLGKWLREHGYQVGTSYGKAIEGPLSLTSDFGLLRQYPPGTVPRKNGFFKKILTGNVVEWPSREFVGTLWLNHSQRGVGEGHWVLEVYGAHNVSVLADLADEIIRRFNSQISVKLVAEQTQWEYFGR